MFGGEFRFDFRVVEDAAARGVDDEDPPGLQPAFADDARRVDVEDSDFAGHDDKPVVGDPVAAGAQAVAVQDRADDRAVREGDRGRSVPRLHEHGVELVEGPHRRVHFGVVFPRLGDHHEHRVRQGPSAQVQQFKSGVEGRGVGLVGVDDGEEPGEVAGDEVAGEGCFAGPHPVAVAFDRVDLPVVGDVAERVRQGPRREGVGGEPRVHQRQPRRVPRVGEVREEGLELGCGQHALVGDGARRKAGEVDAGFVFGALAHAVGVAFQVDPGEPFGGGPGTAGEEHLREERHGFAGHRSAVPRVDGQVAPAEHGEVFFCGDAVDGGDRGGAGGFVGGEERDSCGVGPSVGERETADVAVELVGMGEDAHPAVVGVGS